MYSTIPKKFKYTIIRQVKYIIFNLNNKIFLAIIYPKTDYYAIVFNYSL